MIGEEYSKDQSFIKDHYTIVRQFERLLNCLSFYVCMCVTIENDSLYLVVKREMKMKGAKAN